MEALFYFREIWPIGGRIVAGAREQVVRHRHKRTVGEHADPDNVAGRTVIVDAVVHHGILAHACFCDMFIDPAVKRMLQMIEEHQPLIKLVFRSAVFFEEEFAIDKEGAVCCRSNDFKIGQSL